MSDGAVAEVPKELTREMILGMADLSIKEVVVEAWGDSVVYIRELTAKERGEYERLVLDQNKREALDPGMLRARLVVMCLVDKDGNRMFKDDEAHMLDMKSSRAIDFLFDEAQKHSGLDAEALDDAKGESEAGQS